MQKPGLGARKCGHCGARIEGPQSHLLQHCPQCRSPLYGRYVPAPATQMTGPPKSGGSGLAILAVFGVLGFLGIATAGVVYVFASRKGEGTPVSSPPPSVSTPTPVLAETATVDAAASATIPKKPAGKTAETKPLPSIATPVVPTKSVPVPPVIPSQPPPTPSSTGLALLPGRCSATIAVGRFRPSSPTCSFNEKVSTGPGKLDFPCEGGAASVAFGSQTFRGTVTAANVSLTNIEPFTFGGCRVESTQRITGARASNTGLYTYSERIVSGSGSGTKTCTATATVEFR